MTHDLRITLSAEEVQEAVISYATKALDLGVSFSRNNISIDYLSSTMGGELRIIVGELAPVQAAHEPAPIPVVPRDESTAVHVCMDDPPF